jgi:hypothetical protein
MAATRHGAHLPARDGWGGLNILLYLAVLSSALSVIHPLLAASLLGAGEIAEKYAKRPLLFALAHFCTHYFERWFIERGRLLAARCGKRGAPFVMAVPAQPRGAHDGA